MQLAMAPLTVREVQRSALARWYGDRMPDVRDDVLTFAWHAA